MISNTVFKSIDVLQMENDKLKVIIIPKLGGKIASIYEKNKKFEALFQNKNSYYKKPKLDDDFEKFDAAGFDDAFPSIDRGIVKYNGHNIKYPDHGEIWSGEFDYKIENEQIYLIYKSEIMDYVYMKKISLFDNNLVIEYSIENVGNCDIESIWTMHCLFKYENNMELKFPNGSNSIINVIDSNYLGEKGSIHPFPETKDKRGNIYKLDRVKKKESKNQEKYYLNTKVKEGKCGIYYPERDINLLINFPSDKLPYLGFWITEGEFRGDYNCAFEPSNGFYDSIDIAKKNNSLFILKSKEKLEFEIKISLS